MTTLRADWLRCLPDDPMHVEVRGLLLGRAEVQILADPAAPRSSGLLFAERHGLAVGFGAPPATLARELRSAAADAGVAREGVKLHLPLAVSADWLALEGVRSLGRNTVQALPDDAALERLAAFRTDASRVLTDASDPALRTLPSDLQAEFASLDPWPSVVAIHGQDRIQSIAYAFVETETYFDLSIDTVSYFRREGLGTACAAALIRHQAGRGKRPVWVASESSRASLALSSKLGFEDVGHVQCALLE